MEIGFNKGMLKMALVVIVVLFAIKIATNMFPALAQFKSQLGLS